MKAAVLERPGPVESGPLAWTEVPDPAPEPGRVVVRVSACGICRTDLHIVEGELPARRGRVVPGHQVVGIVTGVGPGVISPTVGERVGVAWVHRTCGACAYCRGERENLCENAEFTGWTVDGGYAESVSAPAEFVHRLPEGIEDLHAAPLLCAGIIGFRALRLTGLGERAGGWAGTRLGLHGFGAAGHVVIQLARARGAEVYVCTRDRERHQALARELGAAWVGGATDEPPVKLDASILFAPAGELVPRALGSLDKGGTLVLAGIHMSPVPAMEYGLLYHERTVRSVANNTREDAREFLMEAARIPVRTSVRSFPMSGANEALLALKTDAIRGAGVLVPG